MIDQTNRCQLNSSGHIFWPFGPDPTKAWVFFSRRIKPHHWRRPSSVQQMFLTKLQFLPQNWHAYPTRDPWLPQKEATEICSYLKKEFKVLAYINNKQKAPQVKGKPKQHVQRIQKTGEKKSEMGCWPSGNSLRELNFTGRSTRLSEYLYIGLMPFLSMPLPILQHDDCNKRCWRLLPAVKKWSLDWTLGMGRQPTIVK